jgi:CRISPR system Cascade subunit CasA
MLAPTHENRMTKFDLIDQPWIPVTSAASDRSFASLRALLEYPERWRGIETANPVECLALYRLLLAICHRAIGPGDRSQRLSALESWPRAALAGYLDRWKPAFDLFDADRPFMQAPALRTANELRPSPWTRLAFDRASGNVKRLWDHSRDAAPTPLDFASAARVLVAHLQFTPGGLVKALRTSGTAGPGASLLLSMPLGRNLAETLALCLIPQTAAEFAGDLPAWEAPAPGIGMLKAGAQVVPPGPAARYTWLSRAVLYLPDHGTVSRALFAEGIALAAAPVPDPMSATMTVKGEQRNLLIREDRALWRDFHALAGAAGGKQPAVVENAAALRLAHDNYDPIDLLAGGLQPDQMKLILWRLEERRISPRLLERGGQVLAALESGVQLAEAAGNGFFAALGRMASGWLHQGSDNPPSQAAVSEVRNRTHAMPRFWGSLEPAYWRFVSRLSAGANPETCLDEWRADLQSSLRSAWTQATEALGSDGRALAAAASAHRHLATTIAEVRKA